MLCKDNTIILYTQIPPACTCDNYCFLVYDVYFPFAWDWIISKMSLSLHPQIRQLIMRIILILGALFVIQGITRGEENAPLREQNLSSVTLDAKDIRDRGIYDISDLTSIVPGLFIPSYGSAQETAIYLRGVGSYANTPAVGLYVDDIPWLEKSSFHTRISEVDHIEVLRGPQNTLYGRNTMGGLIRITTKNPIDYQGTVIERSMSKNRCHYTNISHYQRFSDKLGFTAGIAYRSGGQFFKNNYTGVKADADQSLRAHTKLLFRPSEVLNVDFLANYELRSQDAFPYYIEHVSDDDAYKEQLVPIIGQITSNEDNTYLRHLLNVGLKAERTWSKVTFSNVLGFQLLNDDARMDQDFSYLDLGTLQQKQFSRTLSEEIVLRSRPGVWRHWEWITGASFSSQWLYTEVDGNTFYDAPKKNAAVYHQSTMSDLFHAKGLDMTLGLRMEYDYVGFSCLGQSNEKLYDDWWQLMPHASLQYSFRKGNVYTTVSRGYRSGGYNYLMPGDVPQLYRPEYAWNYEVGTHLDLVNGRVLLDASVFLTNVTDQQIAQMDPAGLGFVAKNTGRSQSFGGELALRSQISDRFGLHVSYGYTHAKFTEYMLSSGVSYEGNYVPFVPRHTFDLGANYIMPFPKLFNRQLIDRMAISTNWHGIGKRYWTEDNTISDPVNSSLDVKFTFYREHLEFGVWAANILSDRCRAYYFQSQNRGYAQLNMPFRYGFEMKLTFN